ncbi:MAG: hypothetical protein MJE77_03255 [Proteobacteria bacterium]|nr:hypothetical protein [Pseudomonadota bacterium]
MRLSFRTQVFEWEISVLYIEHNGFEAIHRCDLADLSIDQEVPLARDIFAEKLDRFTGGVDLARDSWHVSCSSGRMRVHRIDCTLHLSAKCFGCFDHG